MKLRDIRPGYIGGCPPEGWLQNKLVSIQQAKTWHWLAFVQPVVSITGNIADVTDWVTSESINKGTVLTRLAGRNVYIYRIKGLTNIDSQQLIDIHSEYGELPYDWQANYRTAVWYLLKHYLGKTIPVLHDKAFNCQEWVCLIASELGIKIIPDNEYPTPYALEHSRYLEYVGEVNK